MRFLDTVKLFALIAVVHFRVTLGLSEDLLAMYVRQGGEFRSEDARAIGSRLAALNEPAQETFIKFPGMLTYRLLLVSFGSSIVEDFSWPPFQYTEIERFSREVFNGEFARLLNRCRAFRSAYVCYDLLQYYERAQPFGQALFWYWLSSDEMKDLIALRVAIFEPKTNFREFVWKAAAGHDPNAPLLGLDPLVHQLYIATVMPDKREKGTEWIAAQAPFSRVEKASRLVYEAVFSRDVLACADELEGTIIAPRAIASCRNVEMLYRQTGLVGKAIFTRFIKISGKDLSGVMKFIFGEPFALVPLWEVPVESMASLLGLGEMAYGFRSALPVDKTDAARNAEFDRIATQIEGLDSVAMKDAILTFDSELFFAENGPVALSMFLAVVLPDRLQKEGANVCASFASSRAAADGGSGISKHHEAVAGVIYRKLFEALVRTCSKDKSRCFGLQVMTKRSRFAAALVESLKSDSRTPTGFVEAFCSTAVLAPAESHESEESGERSFLETVFYGSGCDHSLLTLITDQLITLTADEQTWAVEEGGHVLGKKCRVRSLEFKIFFACWPADVASLSWPSLSAYHGMSAAAQIAFDAIYKGRLDSCLGSGKCSPLERRLLRSSSLGRALFFYRIGTEVREKLRKVGIAEDPTALSFSEQVVQLASPEESPTRVFPADSLSAYLLGAMENLDGSFLKWAFAAYSSIEVDQAAGNVYNAIFKANVEKCAVESEPLPGTGPACLALVAQFEQTSKLGKAIFARFTHESDVNSGQLPKLLSDFAPKTDSSRPPLSLHAILNMDGSPTVGDDVVRNPTFRTNVGAFIPNKINALIVYDPSLQFALNPEPEEIQVFFAAVLPGGDPSMCTRYQSFKSTNNKAGLAAYGKAARAVYDKVFAHHVDACIANPRMCSWVIAMIGRSPLASRITLNCPELHRNRNVMVPLLADFCDPSPHPTK